MSNTVEPRVVRPGEAEVLNVMGSPTIIHLPAEATGGQFSLVELRGDAGVAIPAHVHEREDETFHVVEGVVRFTVGQDAWKLGPGGTAFGPRGIEHSWAVVEGPARIVLVLTPGGMERMFPELARLGSGGPPSAAAVGEVCGRYGVTFV